MNIENKIRKRIQTLEMAKGMYINEIQITKQEAEKLEDLTMLDGRKLIIVDKLGNLTKKDCFAHIERNGHKSCYCLNKLYCKNGKCKFYNNNITIEQLEYSIKLYELKNKD